jgi:uncharacterized delta-60 repeat protein
MKKILLFLFALVTLATQAQTPGDIAQSYGTTPGFNNNVGATATQTDGKILVGGAFTLYNGATENRIIRLNTDGSKDTSFNTGLGFNNNVSAITTQSDGKILVAGNFTTYNGVTENRIIRLNSDGTKDTSFTTGTGFNNLVQEIAQQADGKILVGGYFTSYNGVTERYIVRLNSDGTKDTSFTTGIGFNDSVQDIAQQADGKILVGGNFFTYNGVTENRIIRLNADGTKDATFSTGTGFNNFINTIAQQADGKILVGGNFTTYNGVTEIRIIRLNADGTKDATFTSGTGFTINVSEITEQADGKILVGGQFTTYNGVTENKIIRLNTDGSKDTAFATGTGFGSNFNDYVRTFEQQSDGKILVGGSFFTYNGVNENFIIRLNTDGTKDATFYTGNGTSTGFDGLVYTISQQTDGKNLVGGSFTSYKGITENRIIRLNTDGTKDTSFNIGTGFNGNPSAITTQSDGKIIVGGSFTSYNGVTENRIIRINNDGTKDTSFNTGTGFDGNVWNIQLQPDGKILVVGFFTAYKGLTENRIIRLNSDGTKDTSFNTGTGFDGNVWKIQLQPDGKILIGGFFTTFNGSTQNRIIRLNADGTKDTSFDVNTGFNGNVWNIQLQPDGKIIAGGFFTSFNGLTENRIIRLNTDGTKDITFNTGTGFDNSVRAIELQNDGKIVVGGLFTTYNGVTENRIITLNTDGTKDTAFINGTGFDSDVYSIKQLADGKILVGGNFTTYKGDNSSAYLIKLHTEASISNTTVLTQIGNEGDEPNTVTATVTTAQLGQILPAITDLVAANQTAYQAYIDANPALFASPATAAEVQAMVTAVNAALSTDNFEASTKLAVYPNPSKAIFNIEIDQNASLELFDIVGKQLRTTKINLGTSQIDLTDYNSGVYFLKITNKTNQTKTVRLIKQ